MVTFSRVILVSTRVAKFVPQYSSISWLHGRSVSSSSTNNSTHRVIRSVFTASNPVRRWMRQEEEMRMLEQQRQMEEEKKIEAQQKRQPQPALTVGDSDNDVDIHMNDRKDLMLKDRNETKDVSTRTPTKNGKDPTECRAGEVSGRLLEDGKDERPEA